MNDAERIQKVRALLDEDLSEAILTEALTHRARLNSHPKERSYERLEFLGDAVLDLIVAETLLQAFPKADEGELTQRRAAFVSEPALAAAAKKCGLAPLIRLSKSQTMMGDTELPSICSDVVESLLAAVFLERGLDRAKKAAQRLLGAPPKELPKNAVDHKTELQECLQAIGGMPVYEIFRDGGSEHAPIFKAVIFYKKQRLNEGIGRNKKSAAQNAAKKTLQALYDIRTNGDNDKTAFNKILKQQNNKTIKKSS